MNTPSTSLFGLRYAEKLSVPLAKDNGEMRMSYPGDPRDTGMLDPADRADQTMRMSYPGDPRDTGLIDMI